MGRAGGRMRMAGPLRGFPGAVGGAGDVRGVAANKRRPGGSGGLWFCRGGGSRRCRHGPARARPLRGAQQPLRGSRRGAARGQQGVCDAGGVQPLRHPGATPSLPATGGHSASSTGCRHASATSPRCAAPQEAKPHGAQELWLLRHSGVHSGSHSRAAEEARGTEPEGRGAGQAGAGAAKCCSGKCCNETEQLAPAALLLPYETLLLPGHPSRNPHGVPENCLHYVLPLDGQRHCSLPKLRGLPGLVLCGTDGWFRLWSLHPLGSPLHPLLLCVLVQADVQSLQERQLVQLLRLLLHLLYPGHCVCPAGCWHPTLGVQRLDIESDCAEEELCCGSAHDPGIPALHGGGCAGCYHAEEDPLYIPSDGRQLPESTRGVCCRGVLEPSSAHGCSQCRSRGSKQCLPGQVVLGQPWLRPRLQAAPTWGNHTALSSVPVSASVGRRLPHPSLETLMPTPPLSSQVKAFPLAACSMPRG